MSETPPSVQPPKKSNAVPIAAGLFLLVLIVAGAVGGYAMMNHAATPAVLKGDAARGKTVYLQSCTSCHGLAGYGMPMQGADLTVSKFIPAASDEQLVAMIRAGREPNDPNSVMHLKMLPKGGNPNLTEQDLHDVAAYVRKLYADDKK
ncbi:MAG: cytochrome c [Tepidisphaeraceae bacterium]